MGWFRPVQRYDRPGRLHPGIQINKSLTPRQTYVVPTAPRKMRCSLTPIGPTQ
ncbi:hypothetical protein I553_1001 [Mycobacterium xenopi 4042]|uniref:Uncharacterized protein n=1 Tax=Mycobacterium xenopi 4042 TaxID=1299334 RepID=X7ZAJ4_MYCXE|nr:hypothetical protein I553_1001 [Mycobacterium xenopi 4042]